MDNIKDIIKSVIEDISYKKGDGTNPIEVAWKEVLNGKEVEHTKIIGEKDKFLSIYVDTPAWLYQMKIKKNTILKKLQEKGFSFRGIYFKLGKVK
ncbi:MAG: DUF721 domain-containing protein [Candidatus Omnitrophica bacterium]|nr:DUF721 domain-containing protein [Candidatus Omnitrophota bacterium]MCB9747093.1 DUF721 domain-containing protein [Candidatus Omnitrophota bacterium]